MTAAQKAEAPGVYGRMRELNRQPPRPGRYVMYWMQQSQRAEENPALQQAVLEADRANLPLVAVFGFFNQYPRANPRHLAFMAQGLADVEKELARRGIGFVIRPGHPMEVALDMSRHAAAVVCDRGYFPFQEKWRREMAQKAGCPVLEVEGDAVVPVNRASTKAEYAARTIRPKILGLLDDFLTPPPKKDPDHPFDPHARGMPAGISAGSDEIQRLVAHAPGGVKPVDEYFTGGTDAALARFSRFLDCGLQNYSNDRDLTFSAPISRLGPYLHFGQISPVFMARKIREKTGDAAEAFLEQLVVRRELAINFIARTPDFDTYSRLPQWARNTLEKHAKDRREHVYDEEDLIAGNTHDPYWNAAMKEMRITGFLHNRLRMYWGKKILEWTPRPETAHRILLKLNAYFLDGRDPNSYAGCGWIFGLHDRPWKERPVFGTVRYMAASGLKRKCDMAAYLDHVQGLERL